MQNKALHFLVFSALSGVSLSAQNMGTIRGSITVQDGSVLHDATVLLMPVRRSMQTDAQGRYEFRDLPPGRYDVLAHLHAFTDERRSVTVEAGQTVQADIALNFAPVRQQITVTASGTEETTLEAFSSVTSLDGHQLGTRTDAPSLGEMLDHEPGVAKRSYGPGSSRPVIRGFDGDRVLILQDGTRTGTLSSQSGDHGEPVDGAQVERVEIVRGPATLLYGSNAVGGVVNVITRHHELEQHPHPGVRGHLSATAGTNNGLGGGGGGFEVGLKNWLVWGMGSGQRTGDYQTPIGKVENSFSNIVQTSAGFGRYAPKDFFTFSYGLQDGRYGVPPAELQDSEGHDHAHENVSIDWRRHNVRFNGGFRELQGWLDSFRATVNYSDWRHSELEAEQIGTRFSNRQGTWQALFQQAKRGHFSGSFGTWGMHRAFNTQGAEALAPPVDQNAVAVFGVEELGFERFRLQFGGRVEHNGYSPGGGLQSRSFTGASGSAGLWVKTWTGGAVVANYTSSFRAPALEELYNRGPHLGNLAWEIGNPNLNRERAHGMELSLRQNTGRIRAELNGYYNRILDFVYLAPTGRIEEGLIEAVYDQADARYLGAEARFDYRFVDSLWLNTRFDYVDAQLTMSRMSLPRIPPARGVVALDWQRGGFNFRPELILTNRQWQIFPTETTTAGYGLFNLLGSYTIAGVHRTHMFSVNWFNATDQLYRNHLSFIKQFAPEIGQGVRFMYTVNFY